MPFLAFTGTTDGAYYVWEVRFVGEHGVEVVASGRTDAGVHARGQVAQRGSAGGRRGVEGAAMYEARGVPGVRVRERRVQSERADVSVERGVKLFPVVMSVPPCEERGSSVRRVVHTLSLLVEQRGQPQQQLGRSALYAST